ncbi:MAG: prepilin-type N-terminal cleavage/methylation domain-containing protein [Candidatus Brocadiia bacterium]
MQARRSRGFTLIELIIVVGVVGLLAGLLLPALASVRQVAHATTCRNNLSALGGALSLYMGEHRGFIPRRGQGVRPLGVIDRPSDWFNCLPPYCALPSYQRLVAEGRKPQEGDDLVIICPRAEDPGGLYFLPYAMNMYLSPWIRPWPHNIDELPRPSLLVFMADGPGPYSSTVPSKKAYSVVPRHQGKANLVFVDGHVAAFEGSYLGCGVGDPHRSDVQWETGSRGINQDPVE